MSDHHHDGDYIGLVFIAVLAVFAGIVLFWSLVSQPRFEDVQDRISVLEGTPVAEEQR